MLGSITLSASFGAYALAFLGGLIPAVLWFFFWIRMDNRHKEPYGLLLMTFIAGMLSVIIVLPIEKFIASLPIGTGMHTILWASAEEILKYCAFAAIAYKSPYIDEPIDYCIYLITAALGFAALENTLFLIQPLTVSDTTVSFLTGNLRYMGATLLHAVSSGLIGIGLGLAYFKEKETRSLYGILGLGAAILLHSVFNFFIIEKSGENFFQVFGFLWVTTIIIMLLFEKLRRMGKYAMAAQQQEQL